MIKLLAYFQNTAAALRDREDGQALVEYALILGLVSVAAIVVLGLIGIDVDAALDEVEGAL
jgi:Flp pilus assembly pilin Flp